MDRMVIAMVKVEDRDLQEGISSQAIKIKRKK